MSYKITITNNKNGEIIVNEENAVAIVGAIGNEQGTRSIVFTDCDAISLGDAISAAEDVISRLKRWKNERNFIQRKKNRQGRVDRGLSF